jgi:hypothetical protein
MEEAAAAARARLGAPSAAAAFAGFRHGKLPIALMDKAQAEHKFRDLALI